MDKFSLKYLKGCHPCLYDNHCGKVFHELRQKIRKVLKIDVGQSVFVCTYSVEDEIETVFMTGVYQAKKMKIYFIKKTPEAIDEEDIKNAIDRVSRMKPYPILLEIK